jgi:predicted dehydrogenase
MKNITIGVIGAGLIGRKHLRKLAERSGMILSALLT